MRLTWRMLARLLIILLVPGLALTPATARLWKPTPQQLAQDYALISYNKGADGRVSVQWVAAPTMSTPLMQQILSKYILLSISRTRQTAGGTTSWDDVIGVTVSDGKGVALKEVPDDAVPPNLVGFLAQINASNRQATQGLSKTKLMLYEAGSVGACVKGQMQVGYEGENYTFDTPMPGCAKP